MDMETKTDSTSLTMTRYQTKYLNLLASQYSLEDTPVVDLPFSSKTSTNQKAL